MEWYVYILECCDGSLYVGHTYNVEMRLKQHNAKQGAKWTAQRVPVKLVFVETYDSEPEAMQRERQLKGWSKAKKKALIVGDHQRLKYLGKCRSTGVTGE